MTLWKRIRGEWTFASYHSHHEHEHSAHGQDTSNVVDLPENFSSRHALGIDSWWRVVEDDDHDLSQSSISTNARFGIFTSLLTYQADKRPQPTNKPKPSPVGIVCNELTARYKSQHRCSMKLEERSTYYNTDGKKGKIEKINTATYFPLFEVGANSDVAARAVSSLIPAPTPANTMPQMK